MILHQKTKFCNWKTLPIMSNMEIIILQAVSFDIAIRCIVCDEFPTITEPRVFQRPHWRFYPNNKLVSFFQYFSWYFVLNLSWITPLLLQLLKIDAWMFMNLCKSVKILFCIGVLYIHQHVGFHASRF